MVVLAAQAIAPQVQHAVRRHAHEGPRDGRSAVRAFAQDGVQRAGVAAAGAGGKAPGANSHLRVREPRLVCTGQYMRDAVRHRIVRGVAARCALDSGGQGEACVGALRNGNRRKAATRRQEKKDSDPHL